MLCTPWEISPIYTFFPGKTDEMICLPLPNNLQQDQPRYQCQTRGTDGWSEGVPGEDNYGCRDGRHLYMKRYLKSNIVAFSGSVFHKEPPGNNLFAHYTLLCQVWRVGRKSHVLPGWPPTGWFSPSLLWLVLSQNHNYGLHLVPSF